MRREERLEKEETEENARGAERENQNQIEGEGEEEEEYQIFDQDKRTSPTTVQSSANQVGRSSGKVNCK